MRSPAQGSVLGLGLLVDGNIGVGLFPQGEKLFIRVPGGGLVTHHLLRAAELEPRQRPYHVVPGQARMIDQLLKLRCC